MNIVFFGGVSSMLMYVDVILITEIEDTVVRSLFVVFRRVFLGVRACRTMPRPPPHTS